MPVVDVVPLHETTRTRYLNYAMSVITSRALPDVRDGLKPVHRRILYAMLVNLRLTPDSRYRKSATVVGEVMGKYHPHGDSAIYDSMVRMAQSFSLRVPLVDGQGNFGSLDGDSAAAMRYTEAKLSAAAIPLLEEIRKDTVPFRPNFDGSLHEPVVLPARYPHLLINGSAGIAVGMATNIPPHNPREIIEATIKLIDAPQTTIEELVGSVVKGPDFPTGGALLNTEDDLRAIYTAGEGTLLTRGTYEMEGKTQLIITSIPYGVNKSTLVEQMGDHIAQNKVPQLVDVRDESAEDVRIVLELKRGAEPDAAMAYLLKHTDLQTRFHVNMTCLVPTEREDITAPQKCGLLDVLRYFIDFRLEVVTRRLQFDLNKLETRIHILRGFEIIFDGLDEAIRIIRSSSDKADAAQRLMHRFSLDEVQADAILETKLYRISQLEIESIRGELAEKEAEAARIRALLESIPARMALIREELAETREALDGVRRTAIVGPENVLEAYSEDAYIIEEDVYAIVTRDGWVKRQRSFTDVGSIRVRDGDSVGWVVRGSTRASILFVTDQGRVYTTRFDALPATTGHGDPIQRQFDFSDGEKVVGVFSLDKRVHNVEGDTLLTMVVATSDGMMVRIPFELFVEPSTRSGRNLVKLGQGQWVVAAESAQGDEMVCLGTLRGMGLIFGMDQMPIVRGPAKGVIGIRLGPTDRLVGMALTTAMRQGLELETNKGKVDIIRPTRIEPAKRAGKGKAFIKRATFERMVPFVVEQTW
ncbi:MAG: DNA topoisomerase 4 subunit A [Bacteroidetes bacterium]|nr:DNA topoisomerase 4 subunit A [Bacteroidota bacterium]